MFFRSKWRRLPAMGHDMPAVARLSRKVRGISTMLGPETRVAAILPFILPAPPVEVFSEWNDRLAEFEPEALAAKFEDLLALPSELPRCVRALLPCSNLADGPLDLNARDALWERFELPLFETLLGPEGDTLAMECEAHEGLHVADGVRFEAQGVGILLTHAGNRRAPALATGLTAEVSVARCPCGLAGTRLLGLAKPERVRRPEYAVA